MDEFINQGIIEKELEIPTCLMGGSPIKEDVVKMGGSQIGFMNLFAAPLFSGIMEVLPGMSFGIKSINKNKLVWEERVAEETKRRSVATQSPQTKPVQETIDAIQQKTEEYANTLQNGRSGSVTLAQLQPKSRATISGPPLHKSSPSAANLAHLTQLTEQGRRSSLGPTVLPLAKADMANRRSSGEFQSAFSQSLSSEDALDLTDSQHPQHDVLKTSPVKSAEASPIVQPMPPARNLSLERPPLDTEPSDPETSQSESTAVEFSEPLAIPSPAVQSPKLDRSVVHVSSVRRKSSRFSLKFWKKKNRGADSPP